MDFSEQWNLETIKRELEAHRRTEQYKHDILTDLLYIITISKLPAARNAVYIFNKFDISKY